MIEFVFEPFDANHVPVLKQWYEDRQLHHYGGADGPERVLALMRADPLHRHCYMVRKAEDMIGFVDIELEDRHAAWIGLVVNPSFHNQQYGRKILALLESLPVLHDVHDMHAGIDEKNEPSLRCFRAAGFLQRGESGGEGIINFTKSKKPR